MPLPQPMHHTVAVGLDGVLYVLGGEISNDGLANQGIYIDAVYAFDPSTATWTQKASMPTARSAASGNRGWQDLRRGRTSATWQRLRHV